MKIARTLTVFIPLLFVALPSQADRFKIAAKGARAIQTVRFGILLSFDPATGAVSFEADPPLSQGSNPDGTREAIKNLLTGKSGELVSVSAKDAEIVISPDVQDPQKPFDGTSPIFSEPQQNRDKDLLRVQADLARAAKVKADSQPTQRDLTACKVRGKDSLLEKSAATSKQPSPITGLVQAISSGFVSIKRDSDSLVMKYALSDLTEIRIGMCY